MDRLKLRTVSDYDYVVALSSEPVYVVKEKTGSVTCKSLQLSVRNQDCECSRIIIYDL